MEILTLHGVVNMYDPTKQVCRSYVPEKALRAFLQTRQNKFGIWKGEETQDDILTIDDATMAGARACEMAREEGHEVYFFVNPYQFINKCHYWFSVFNHVLDSRRKETVVYEDVSFALTNKHEVTVFRKKVKDKIKTLPPDQAMTIVKELAAALGTDMTDMPEHLSTITIEALKQLQSCGVHIVSHGWDHREISALSVPEISEDILATSKWIQDVTGTVSKLYAIPFGETEVPKEIQGSIDGDYFLSTYEHPPGHVSGKCWNRIDITNELQKK